jgi:hypothetical protein
LAKGQSVRLGGYSRSAPPPSRSIFVIGYGGSITMVSNHGAGSGSGSGAGDPAISFYTSSCSIGSGVGFPALLSTRTVLSSTPITSAIAPLRRLSSRYLLRILDVMRVYTNRRCRLLRAPRLGQLDIATFMVNVLADHDRLI